MASIRKRKSNLTIDIICVMALLCILFCLNKLLLIFTTILRDDKLPNGTYVF